MFSHSIRLHWAVGAVVLAVLCAGTAQAATRTWTGNGATAIWSDANNWSPPGTPVAGEDLVFPAGAMHTTNNNDLPVANFNTLSFTAVTGGSAYVLGGNGFTVTGDITDGPGGNTLSFTTALTAQSFVCNTNGATLSVTCAVNNGGALLQINRGNNVGSVSISGVISGAGGLTMGGGGTLTLAAANTYNGTTTTISGGKVVVANANAIPTGAGRGDVVVHGVLDLNGNSITVNGLTGTGLVDNTSASSVTFTVGNNDVTSTCSVVIQNTAGALGLTKIGLGALTLLDANSSYTGQTTINAGTLSVTSLANGGVACSLGSATSGTPILLGSSTAAKLSYGGPSVSTDRQIAVNGTGGGTIRASSGDLTLTGAINNSGNLLTLDTNSGNIFVTSVISGAGALTETGGSTLTLSGANTYGGDTTISAGTLRLGASNALPNGASAGNVIVNGSLDVFAYGGMINGLSGTGTVDNGMTGPCTLMVGNNDATSTFGGVMQNTGGGALALTKIGAGTLTLSGPNTYSGDTAISAGTLALGASDVLPDGQGTGNVIVGGTLDMAGNSDTINGLYGTGIVDNSVAGGPFTLTVGNDDASSTFGGVIQNTAGTLALSKIGVGTLILAKPGLGPAMLTRTGAGTLAVNGGGNTNTYSGDTTISAGTLALGASDVLPDGPGTGNVIVNGTLDMAGNNDTINGLSGSGTVDNSMTGPSTLAAGNNDVSSTFGGVIQSSGAELALTKTGTGALTLSGSNTYSGGTTLSAGTLNINSATALGAGTGTFFIDGGTIDNTSGGAITLTNNSAHSWNADFTFAGTNSLNLGTGPVALGANLTVATNPGGALTVGGVISGAFSLTKALAGTLVLNGSNTFSGATTVNGGLLTVNGTQANSPVTVNSGGTLAGTGTVAGVTVPSGQTGAISPSAGGTATATLTTAAVSLSSSATFTVDLNGTGPAAANINAPGQTVSLGGSNLTVSSVLNSSLGTVYTIVNAGSVSGTFGGLLDGAILTQGVRRFRIHYTATTVTLGHVPPAPVISSSTTAGGTAGLSFSYQISASNNPTSFDATPLPAGISVNTSKGVINGTPTVSGDTSVTINATNAGGTGSATLTISVAPGPASTLVVGGFPSPATAGTAGNSTVTAKDANGNTATGYTGTVHFTSSDGAAALPGDYTFVSGDAGAKTFSATLNTAGTQSITATDTATASINGTQSGITVNLPPPAITSPTTVTGVVNQPFSYTITAANNPTSFSATNLPPGLSVDTASGAIAGTPTAAGITSATISATNAHGTDSESLSINIGAQGPAITSMSASKDPMFAGDTTTLAAQASNPNNGTLSFTWNFADGTPAGTGNPIDHSYAAPGQYTVSVTASDGTYFSQPGPLVMVVDAPNSGGENVKNVADGAPPVPNPLNGISITVERSDGGVIELFVDVSAFNRDAFDVATNFNGPASLLNQTPVKGFHPVQKFTDPNVYVATSTAYTAGTTTFRGKARRTLALSNREVGLPVKYTEDPASHSMAFKSIRGRFSFSLGQRAAIASDTVTVTALMELPVGLKVTDEHDLSVGVGNIIDHVKLNTRGLGKSTGDSGSVKRVSIRYPKVDRNTKLTAGPPAKRIARIALTLSAKDLVAKGFDTEGVDPSGNGNRLQVQTAVVLAGVSYQVSAPVRLRVPSRKDAGTITLLQK